MSQHAMQNAVSVPHGRGSQGPPFIATGTQELGIQFGQMDGPELLQAHSTKVRNDVEPEDLPIALERFRADIQAQPIAIPTLGEFSNRFLRWVNAFAGGVLRD